MKLFLILLSISLTISFASCTGDSGEKKPEVDTNATKSMVNEMFDSVKQMMNDTTHVNMIDSSDHK